MSTSNQTPDNAPTFWQMTKSVVAAFFGVQKNEVRERDFQHGKAHHFIILGILATVFFIGTLIGLVMLVLSYTS